MTTLAVSPIDWHAAGDDLDRRRRHTLGIILHDAA
jgi:hypothetical protein